MEDEDALASSSLCLSGAVNQANSQNFAQLSMLLSPTLSDPLLSGGPLTRYPQIRKVSPSDRRTF